MDDLGTGATDFQQGLYGNLKAIFMYIRKSGLKLALGKCEIVPEIAFLGQTISSEGTSPIKAKIDKFLNLKMPKKTLSKTKDSLAFFSTLEPIYRSSVRDC